MSRNANPQTIADLVLRKLRQEARTNQAYKSHQQAQLRMYTCGTCGGDHPTERCRVTNPLKWCEYCRKMTTMILLSVPIDLDIIGGAKSCQCKIPFTWETKTIWERGREQDLY